MKQWVNADKCNVFLNTWCKVNRSESSLIIRSIQITWVSATPCQVFPSLTPSWWSPPSFVSRKTQKGALFRAGVSPGKMILLPYGSHIVTSLGPAANARCLLRFPDLNSNTHCVNNIPDSYLIEGGRECSQIMPESWWSWCTSQHLRADWKVWKMSFGVELGGLRNRWWKVFAPWLASCECLWVFPLCSLENQTWLNATGEREIPAHQSLLVFLVGPVPLPLPR